MEKGQIQIGDHVYSKTLDRILEVTNVEVCEWEHPHGSHERMDYISQIEFQINGKTYYQNITGDNSNTILTNFGIKKKIQKLETEIKRLNEILKTKWE